MRSYRPDWKVSETGTRAHLIARDTNHCGHVENPKTLCKRPAVKTTLLAVDDEPRCKRCLREQAKLRTALVGDSTIAFLEERTFAGMVPGAVHWTGTLWFAELPSVDLTFPMTHLQARAANKSQGTEVGHGAREAGSTSNAFFTREALRAVAVLAYRDHFPEAGALVADHHASCPPHEVLAIHGVGVATCATLNEINARWERLRHGDPASWAAETEYRTLLADLGLGA